MLVLRSRVEDVTLAAVRRYTPRHFAGRLSLFLPRKEWLRSGHAEERWRLVAGDTEEYYGPEGCTGDLLLREPYVAAIAELFRCCREKNEMGTRTLVSRSVAGGQPAGPAITDDDSDGKP